MNFIWQQALPRDPPCEPKKVVRLDHTKSNGYQNIPIFMIFFRLMTQSFGKAGGDREEWHWYSFLEGKKISQKLTHFTVTWKRVKNGGQCYIHPFTWQ